MGVINAQQLEIKYKIDSSKMLNEVEMRSMKIHPQKKIQGLQTSQALFTH